MEYYVALMMFFVLLPGWLCIFIIRARRNITCMAGMMSAMTIGMITGLGAGTTVAVSMPIHSFYSIIIGMLFGGVLGAIAGIPISLMAVLDGLLSGIMAGMMGAMLGDMVSPEFHLLLLKILAIMAGGILFMLHLMLLGEVKQDRILKLPVWLRKPSWMFTVVLISGIGLQSIGSVQPSHDDLSQMEHSGHGSQNKITGEQPIAKQVRIQASEYAYAPHSIRINVNETVEVILKNTGKVEHDFEIADAQVHIHAQPGKQSSGILRFPKPGTYLAVCTVPGHLESGMKFRIEVV